MSFRSLNFPEMNFLAAGTYDFVVPNHTTMTFDVRGGAGGGGGGAMQYGMTPYYGTAGAPGGVSRALLSGSFDLLANGGGGGGAPVHYYTGVDWWFYDGSAGGHGTASGGDTNTTGGGDAASTAGYVDWYYMFDHYIYGGNGGRGGRSIKTFGQGVIPAGSHVSITVGSAGVHGTTPSVPNCTCVQPTDASVGSVRISWD